MLTYTQVRNIRDNNKHCKHWIYVSLACLLLLSDDRSLGFSTDMLNWFLSKARKNRSTI
jgi:hypothetical protein